MARVRYMNFKVPAILNIDFSCYTVGWEAVAACSSRETLRVLHTLLYYKLLYTIACLVFAFINLEISQRIVMSISTLFSQPMADWATVGQAQD
jgi:hypothetical protein